MRTRRIGAIVGAAVLTLMAACSSSDPTDGARRPTNRKPDTYVAQDPLPARPPVATTQRAKRRAARTGYELVPPPAATASVSSGCARPDHAGGAWPSLNGDLSNTRTQPAEYTLDPSRLTPAWTFKGESVGITGGTRSTPIVAGGCVYLAFGMGYLGDRGDVVALNADTGALVWHARLAGSVLGLAARDGLIYATPSMGTRGDVALPVVTADYLPAGSYAVALDAATGRLVWTSQRLDDGKAGNGTFVNASPVVFDAGGRRLVFVPLAGGAGDGARVPMYFLDATTGATVRRAYSLSEADYRAGFGGTGIWSTAAYDPTSQHLYAGTADSDGYTRQHPYNNAILKIDANPTRPTFAKVVGAYRGTTEHANLDGLIGYPHNPVCGDVPAGTAVGVPTFFDTSASPECLELDFDFGGSPNLVRDPHGALVVTALQKSGVFHAVNTQTMQPNWTFLVGPGGPAMDGTTAAVDGDGVFVSATPNVLFRLDKNSGATQWTSTTGFDVFAYQPVTVASGVVYTITDLGVLSGVRAATGLPVLQRAIAADGGFRQCFGVGAGVAVARHLLFVPCDAGGLNDLAGLPSPAGGLVAYRAS